MDSLAGQALQLSGGLLAHQQLEEVSFQRSFRALQAPVKQKIEQLCSIGVVRSFFLDYICMPLVRKCLILYYEQMTLYIPTLN